MELNINELVNKYCKGTKRHDAYRTTTDIAHHLRFHFDGYELNENNRDNNPYFAKLIDARRPGESEEVKAYRRRIYLGKTKAPCSKVLVTLKKIVRSKDWGVSFKDTNVPSRISEDETLKKYLTKNYPYTKSIENWFVTTAIRETIVDPNAVCLVMPISYEVAPTEYIKPFTFIFESKDVLDYEVDSHVIVKTKRTASYTGQNGQKYNTPIYLIATRNELIEAHQLNGNGDFGYTVVYTHNIGKLPAFKLGGQFKELINNSPIYLSLVDAMLNGLDTAAREVSDLDAEVVKHIYSQMWYYAGQSCSSCNGVGKVLKDGQQSVCPTCKGDGAMKSSPYTDIVVKRPGIGEEALSAPFGGYIEKNTEIVKIQDERIAAHISDALSAIFMDFLTPLAQSGTAKAYDRDELNNFVFGCAYHFVNNILNEAIYFINEYRYSFVVPNKEERIKMLPEINTPQSFDLLTANMLSEQITNARNAKHDPLIIAELELQYAEKEFGNDSELAEKLECVKELDPFMTMTVTEKNDCLLNGTVNKRDVYVSNYINQFIERAFEEYPETDKENSGFDDMEYMEKMKIMYTYADEKIAEESGIVVPLKGANGEPIGNVGGGNELASSVGGLTGMIEIVKAVASGVYDLDAAVSLVSQRFGISEDEARKQLGTPTLIQSTEKAEKVATLTT